MSTNLERMSDFEATASHWIHLVPLHRDYDSLTECVLAAPAKG
jgi:hypothetical protein